MGMGNLGINFSPMPGAQQGQGNGMAPIQDAIRVMSLRTPQNPGAGSIAPAGLLNAPGAGAIGGQSPMGLEDLIRKLFGMGMPNHQPQMPQQAQAPQAPQMTNAPMAPPAMGQMPQGGAPTPRVRPGLGNPMDPIKIG